jgi:hypothetical protein
MLTRDIGTDAGPFCGTGLPTDDVDSLPANGRKTAPPPPAVETRRCDGVTPISGEGETEFFPSIKGGVADRRSFAGFSGTPKWE